jgi:hypothetical protein
LELHRASTLRLHRLTRERGPLSVRRACCSICGTIQPAVLARCLDREAVAAGLGARFLLAMPPVRQRRWTEAEVADEVAGKYRTLLMALLANQMADVPKRVPHFLTLSAAAKAVWVDWFNRWGEKQAGSQDEQAAVLAKLEGYAARLALIHHVVAHAAATTNDLQEVGERSMRAGIKLAEWFAHEAWRVYSSCHESTAERDRRSLAEWIEARPGRRTTVKQLQESLRHRYPLSEDAEAALVSLVKEGLGGWEEKPTGPSGGRPTWAFVLHPRPHNHETHKTPAEPSPGAEEADHETAHETPAAPEKSRESGGSVGFVGAVSESTEQAAPPRVVSCGGEVSCARDEKATGGDAPPSEEGEL